MAGCAVYYNNANGGEYAYTIDWAYVQFSYTSSVNDDNTGYDVSVTANLYFAHNMEAVSQSNAMTMYVCTGVDEDGSPEADSILGQVTCDSLRAYSTDSDPYSPSATINLTIPPSDTGATTLYVVCDYSGYEGSGGRGGITVANATQYVYKKFYSDGIPCDTAPFPPLLSAPYMGTLVNANKKKNSDGTENADVSAASNSITVRGDLDSDSDDASYWRSCRTIPPYLNDYDHRTQYGDVTESYSRYCIDTFKANITPRTTYTIYVYPGNDAGEQDAAKYINIRTLSDPPTVTVKSTSKTLNSVTFNYESNYDLNKIFYKYKIGDGGWSDERSQSASGKTGSITISTEPNTTVYIKVYGQEDWDNQKASEPTNASSSCTTYDKAYTKVQDNIIHNNGAISISTTNPSGNELTFQILDGNDVIFSQSVTKDTTSISLSEAQWDNIYKRYGNNNSKSYTVKIITTADSGHNPSSYEATDTRTITLTGMQKTTHVGASGPKRAMVWYSENGVMKHAVVWVGAGGGTKRTI